MAVAVSGIGVCSAIGIGVEASREALRSGRSGIAEPCIVDTSHRFPVGEICLTNDELKAKLGITSQQPISRTSLLGMIAASEAVNNAQLTDLNRVAFISSTSVGGMDLTPLFYKEYMLDSQRGQLRYVAQHDCAASTNSIRRYLGLGGYSTAISTACSSAANAIMMGARLIESGLADTVVAGGTDALSAYTLSGFNSLMILSSERCKPFSANRTGLNLGEGAGYIVLQRPEAAHRPIAMLSGYANANDAHHQTALTPEGRGPQAAMSGALSKAQLEAQSISYVNVHGTATPNNDTAEGNAMLSIFGPHLPLFSSTKGFTGHTLAATGGIESVFSAMMLQYDEVYPNVGFEQQMPELGASPLQAYQKAHLQHVMSNSFGFGGNCSTLIFSRP